MITTKGIRDSMESFLIGITILLLILIGLLA